ncbi:MAG: hypothetical protein JWO31_3794 [Phycisphaerales bacterium]|nr:hypothetical protein [Phycisphaerales bacterium]
MTSRVTDLGEATLAAAPNAAPDAAQWYAEAVRPTAGHVYLQEINADGDKSVVKFRVDEAADDTLKLSWVAVDLKPKTLPPGKGAAGTMGTCGRNEKPR